MRQTYGAEPTQFGEFSIPDSPGPYPVVILIHGGFWRTRYDLSSMNGLAEDLMARGIAVWNIEYRRIGDPDGGWPNTLLDVAAATQFLSILAPVYDLDLARVVAIGHSAGGQLALWLASQARLPANSPLASAPFPGTLPVSLTGVISLAGVLDLEQSWQLNLGEGAVAAFLGASPQEAAERYKAASPIALLPLGIPHILVHGTEDNRVPLGISLRYAEAAQMAGDQVTLIELPGVDHFLLIDPHSYAWETTVEALYGLLAEPAG